MSDRPFRAPSYDLGLVRLAPIAGHAAPLGAALAGIDPWARVGRTADELESYLRRDLPCTFRFALLADGRLAGAVSLREPFMRGPYLELLAVLPWTQGRGIGRVVIDWMAAEAGGHGTNLWLCVTDWNRPALRFYEAAGFETIGPIPDLGAVGTTEIFMRRRLATPRG